LGIARALAGAGWNLAVGGMRPAAEVAEVLTDLGGAGTEVEYVPGDVAREDDRERLVASVLNRFGAVNLLVNNAGRAARVRADLLDATEASFEELLRTNLQGPYFLTQTIARHQVERRGEDPSFRASIVFITSVSAEMASPKRGEYCVSKAG